MLASDMARLELPTGVFGVKKTLEVTSSRPPLSEEPGRTEHVLTIEGEIPGIGGTYMKSGYTGRRETVACLTLYRDNRGKIFRFSSDPNRAAEATERMREGKF